MRILVDENMHRQFDMHLPGHEIKTVQDMEWDSIRNGRLVQLAREHGFEVLITLDKTLYREVSFSGDIVGIIQLAPVLTTMPHLEPLASQVREALETIGPGQYVRIPPEPM